mmetsp:Transcript_78432/g.127212  ORF Transcript_78432/g.127212 Transcript_78432/m.127212 type:complete len:492 (+) Transcript_78432:80-1555(+)
MLSHKEKRKEKKRKERGEGKEESEAGDAQVEAKKRKRHDDEASKRKKLQRDATVPQKAERKAQALGTWNPKATLLKGAHMNANDSTSLLLFYQYIMPLWSEERKQAAVDLVTKVGAELNLGGRVRIAREGFNTTVSGTPANVRAFADALRGFDKHFQKTDFKYIDELKADKAFKDLKIFPVAELVFYGVSSDKAVKLAETVGGGQHLEAQEYHKLMQQPDTVIVDVRNHYEAEIGRFVGQEKSGGARYMDPKMRKSTDFTAWLSKAETKQELQGKQVLMYCTGGVRCERASVLVKAELGNAVKGVYQLQGGIEKYLQTFPQGGFWMGKNKTFDKRESFGVGDVNGIGGILQTGGKKKKGKAGKDADAGILGRCCVCAAAWERYIGKKKCYSCGVPVLMCEECCIKKPDKASVAQQISVRCPLCKADGRTEAADSLDLTSNGIVAKNSSGASATVLKWGGGHSTKKKSRKMPKMCKFGSDCSRGRMCKFVHA